MLVMALSAMSVPAVYAQRNQGAHGNDNRTERRKESARPAGNRNQSGNRGQSGRPGVGASSRPTVGSTRPVSNSSRSSVGTNNSSRPTNSRPNVTTGSNNRPTVATSGRPGVSGNHGNSRPGVGNRPAESSRPNVGKPVSPARPGVAGRPTVTHRPSQNPTVRPPMVAPPHRPYRPVIARPHYRPVPPPAWRPRSGLPVIRGILGLTFGAAFNVSLDYLYNSGYTVDGYGNNIVYLRNVPAMNYIWTDGALYYGNGGLDASSFYYSTPGYDLTRYNAVYSNLVNVYGMPVSVNNAGGTMSSTWFGGNNGYITLSFGAGTAGRFLTTLTLGL